MYKIKIHGVGLVSLEEAEIHVKSTSSTQKRKDFITVIIEHQKTIGSLDFPRYEIIIQLRKIASNLGLKH